MTFLALVSKNVKCKTCKHRITPATFVPCNRCIHNPRYTDAYTPEEKQVKVTSEQCGQKG